MNSPKTTYWNFSEWSTLKKIQNGSLLLFVVLAYLVPMDVLDRFPQFTPFVEFMASWNIQIRRVGEFSGPASQVNMFVYSVAWCLIPIPWVCELLDAIEGNKKIKHDVFERPVLTVLFLLVFAPLFAWLLSYQPWASWPLDTRISRAAFLNGLTRPLISIGFVYAVAWFAMGYVLAAHSLIMKPNHYK